jgi:AAA15 family ATPase/GTPase
MNSNPYHISSLLIENFKSVKHLEISPKRINIFVGKPNVGKSNILEAISMLSNTSTINDVVRFSHTYQLFYDNEVTQPIKIFTDSISAILSSEKTSSGFTYYLGNNKNDVKTSFSLTEESSELDLKNTIFPRLKLSNPDFSLYRTQVDESGKFFNQTMYGSLIESNIKRYSFSSKTSALSHSFNSSFLNPPHGDNLFTILSTNKSLRQDAVSFFEEYGLEFLIDQVNKTFEIQKRIEGLSYKYSYDLIADTLKRIIFYLAAIKSNSNAVILLEEPEAHCFPPYIARIAKEIIEAETNQFFIATHSPYLLNTIIENSKFEDIAVYVSSFSDYQTKVRKLTDEELTEMLDFGTDVFFNYDAFVE